jgi:hypothetical protein
MNEGLYEGTTLWRKEGRNNYMKEGDPDLHLPPVLGFPY